MVDLGVSPLCQRFPAAQELGSPETFYPLKVLVCENCLLAQVDEFASPEEIFGTYAYFSSYSETWLDHARQYAGDAIDRFGIDHDSQVVEVASNDGYLLRWFVERGIPTYGVEPAANVAEAAAEVGVETIVGFFGRELAERLLRQRGPADLIIGNNVLAQVPDLGDFVSGLAALLAPDGVITLEFPHLLQLMVNNQFDTIYHEHFSYFSLGTSIDIFARAGLQVFDVDELPTHGGSLRLYLHHSADDRHAVTDRVAEVLTAEEDAGMLDLRTYQAFGERAVHIKHSLLRVLLDVKASGESIVGYGAAGKGNTLLNYCGIGTDFLDFVVDRNPYKVGRYTPGTHIPVMAPEAIDEAMPDNILILPWNLTEEIADQLQYTAAWDCHFIVPIPKVRRFPAG